MTVKCEGSVYQIDVDEENITLQNEYLPTELSHQPHKQIHEYTQEIEQMLWFLKFLDSPFFKTLYKLIAQTMNGLSKSSPRFHASSHPCTKLMLI